MKLNFSSDDSTSVLSAGAYHEMTPVGFELAYTLLVNSWKINPKYLLYAIPSSLEDVSNGAFLCPNGWLRIFHDG